MCYTLGTVLMVKRQTRYTDSCPPKVYILERRWVKINRQINRIITGYTPHNANYKGKKTEISLENKETNL